MPDVPILTPAITSINPTMTNIQGPANNIAAKNAASRGTALKLES